MSQRRFPKLIQDAIDLARTKLWDQVQWPSPEVMHRRGGCFEVAAYLRQCWSADQTKDILTRFGADIHPDAWPMGPHLTLHEYGETFANLSVGAYTHVGREVFLDLSDRVIIEDSVSLGMRSMVLTHRNLGEYPNKPAAKLIPKKRRPTILRRGCSVGAGCVLLCGVEIGEHAVVNAGVVVDRDVPPRTIVTSTRQKADYQMHERFFRDV
ncbi:MAG: acyltransferase [Myxococcota bacterium]